MREHWRSGYEDTKHTLKRREWLQMPAEGSGILMHEVHKESEFLFQRVFGEAGGGSGIRTHVTVSRKHAFQACAFSHSATPPHQL